ncbi:formyltransferase family protein [Streptomyces pathocidini]|uniref:formyltransferase family protein n=1 Tax=Streptomyces pathocidini TaxID=1650571 RepID=UPI0033E1B2CC
MIFVGRGALLTRAVRHALSTGHRVDGAYTDDPADRAALSSTGVRAASVVSDINTHADRMRGECTDGVVWSVNNRMIFRAPVLDSGLRVYNIHNGLLPQHRGLPSVAVLFALLNGESEYGATLHQVDAGIDTGPVLAERRFPIPPDARYHQVLLRGVRACHELFQSTLEAVAGGRLPTAPPPHGNSAAQPRYYGLRSLSGLGAYADDPAFARATDLGALAPHLPEIAGALAHMTPRVK